MKVRSFWKKSIKSWSDAEIIEEPDFEHPDFIPVRPPEDAVKYSLPCNWDGEKWVVDTESEEYQTLYQKKRAESYPSIGEQLDYIYHNGVDAWKKDVIDPIKEQYPKP